MKIEKVIIFNKFSDNNYNERSYFMREYFKNNFLSSSCIFFCFTNIKILSIIIFIFSFQNILYFY